MDYDQLRHFADSWGLVFLTAVFVGALVWANRSGTRNRYREQADIPFRYDDDKKD